jgi:Na+:H+ antiporter, NhaA family
MATDIAFVVAVLAVLGSRVPSGLKLFLLTLAIVDDIGAILIIAVFYTDDLAPIWLAGAVVAIACVVLLRRVGVPFALAYVTPAAVLWVCLLESGIHATVAGVVLGLLTPARSFQGRQVIEALEHRLHPWSSFVIVPLFALANAGVVLSGSSLDRAATGAIAWGVVVGLVVGKPLGIIAATAFGLRSRLGRLPAGVRPLHVLGVGTLAGIGFTVSLFVAGLSFNGAELDEAKIGVLAASVVSGLIGTVVLVLLGRRTAAAP